MSKYCILAKGHPLHGPYHDSEYGFPTKNESELFERLVMEIFQAGLSWATILKKRQALQNAFDKFDVTKISKFNKADVQRLLKNSSIIRNKAKIEATIFNAQRLIQLRVTHGGFACWIEKYHPLQIDEWTKIFRDNFKFMGPTIVEKFLQSISYLPGAHDKNCPIYQRINKFGPYWKKY